MARPRWSRRCGRPCALATRRWSPTWPSSSWSEQVDAVFSSAVFHWVLDHDLLFAAPAGRAAPRWPRSPRSAAAPATSTACARSAPRSPRSESFAAHFEDFDEPWNYAGAEETEARLEAAGFVDVRCWLQPWTIEPPEPAEFLHTVCLGPHIDRSAGGAASALRREGAGARARPLADGLRAPQHRGPRRRLSTIRRVPPR